MSSKAVPGLAIPNFTWPSFPGGKKFRPPSQKRTYHRNGESRYFARVMYDVALSVLKDGFGNYRTVENPSDEDVQAAAIAYLGGHEYDISDDEAIALTAAGYTVSEE